MTDLSRLLRPKSIAVFGGGWSENVIRQCLHMNFKGDIWPVHPSKKDIMGLPCYPSIESLPAAPDASFIGVNRHATLEIVQALSDLNAGGAVCFASGFREVSDGHNLEHQLIKAAGKMPIFGPNCYGYINYVDGVPLWPDQHGGQHVQSGVAIIAQSSNVAINLTMQKRGLPLAYVVTVGNQAQTDMADLIHTFVEDQSVTTIGLYVESFKDIKCMETALARAHEKGKPVVALKIGKSQVAQKMALSHTASLAGADDLVTAFFERMGVVRVQTLDEMLETLKLLHVLGPSNDNTIGSLSCSGGEASLVADLVDPLALDLRALTRQEERLIGATLPDMVKVSNPLDYHTFTWGDGAKLQATYEAMLNCKFGLTCLIMDIPRMDRCADNGSEIAIAAVIAAVKKTGGRLAVVTSLAENMTEGNAARFIENGIVPLMGLQTAMLAAANAAKLGKWRLKPQPAPLYISKNYKAADRHVMDEWASKQLLEKHGISVPLGHQVHSPEAAVAAAQALGYPVVMKIISAEMVHKSEHGAVIVNLQNEGDVHQAACKLAQFNAPLLVETMVSGVVCELILGLSTDAQFGQYLTIGAGGVMVELLKDAKVILLPADRDFIKQTLMSLQTAQLLNGFRGGNVADIEAVVDTIVSLSEFIMNDGHVIDELDINPLMVCAHGAYAADAFISKGDKTQ